MGKRLVRLKGCKGGAFDSYTCTAALSDVKHREGRGLDLKQASTGVCLVAAHRAQLSHRSRGAKECHKDDKSMCGGDSPH